MGNLVPNHSVIIIFHSRVNSLKEFDEYISKVVNDLKDDDFIGGLT